jgi:hypothetical protein
MHYYRAQLFSTYMYQSGDSLGDRKEGGQTAVFQQKVNLALKVLGYDK